jgi:hypothetical protein
MNRVKSEFGKKTWYDLLKITPLLFKNIEKRISTLKSLPQNKSNKNYANHKTIKNKNDDDHHDNDADADTDA